MSKKTSKLKTIQQHVMTGISFMIPVIVAGGILYALAKGFGGWDIGDKADATDFMTRFWFNVNLLASTAMNFAVAVLTAGIAYSIAGKPGIAPALVIGYISVQIKAGFLGGILMGLVVGYFVRWMISWKVKGWVKNLMPLLIIPVVSTLICGLGFLFIIGNPIASMMQSLQNWIAGFQEGSRFILGAIIGGLMGSDMGGPINKTASAVANGLLADGIYGPVTSKIVGGMVPPLGISLAVLIKKNKFTKEQQDMAKAAIPMGLAFVTEGVLPFAAADPLKVIPSCMLGAGLAGGMTLSLGVESMATHGGLFIVPLMKNPLMFIVSLLAGTLVTAGMYMFLTRNDEALDMTDKEEIEEIDIDIKF